MLGRRRGEGLGSRRGGGSSADEERIGNRFRMRQRLLTIRDRFTIENENGQPAFQIASKLLRVRTTLDFEDMQGNTIYRIQEKLARIRDTMNIEDTNGDTVASVHSALFSPLRDRWKINVRGGANMTTKGNILHHEYTLERDGWTVATISKRWFRVRDTYGVEVANSEDALLVLAITVVIDMMAHEGN